MADLLVLALSWPLLLLSLVLLTNRYRECMWHLSLYPRPVLCQLICGQFVLVYRTTTQITCKNGYNYYFIRIFNELLSVKVNLTLQCSEFFFRSQYWYLVQTDSQIYICSVISWNRCAGNGIGEILEAFILSSFLSYYLVSGLKLPRILY